MTRFLAEAPLAFEERVRRLLPFLLSAHDGQAIPFMVPALLQIASEEADQADGQAWAEALLDPKVCFCS